jgi:hypothetical protein
MTTPTPPPIPNPTDGIAFNLANIDGQLKQVQGRATVEHTMAASTYAQVFATCALVHAVREPTAAVRDLKELP